MGNELKDSMGFIIGHTRRVIVKKLNEALTGNNIPLTYEQFIFLLILNNQTGEITQQDMANLTGKDKSAILRTIDILESKGLVERKGITGDRRKNTIIITRKCNAFFEKLSQIEKNTMTNLREGVSDEDYKVMVKVMLQIQNNASK
ncbi:MarR family winged helix-turn-helix transcriptional regulator [Rubrolithibacter danxiaensis]|uniref:MarR family winged helix-turn-helix transcriptional regulator n=1 Tax=Rubrolithibacter danxiaensis TaxID=3390805 RepID=UPI003BF84652